MKVVCDADNKISSRQLLISRIPPALRLLFRQLCLLIDPLFAVILGFQGTKPEEEMEDGDDRNPAEELAETVMLDRYVNDVMVDAVSNSLD